MKYLKKILNSDMPNRCEYIKQEESTYEGIFFLILNKYSGK